MLNINIFKIYTPDGKDVLYEFGAEDNNIKYGSRKYGTFKYGEKTNDGTLLSLELFFDCDSICSELQSASMGATLTSNKKLNIPEKAKAKIWTHSGSFVGTFELEKPQRTAMNTYSLTGYDYIGVADAVENFGFSLQNSPLLLLAEAFERVGIPVILSEAIKNDVITGNALVSAYTMREVLQHLAVAYGYKVRTLGVDGIEIFSENEASEHIYSVEQLKEGVGFVDETIEIDKVEISTTELEAEQQESGHPLYDGIGSRPVIGYVPLTDGDFTVVRFSATGENPLDMSESEVGYEDTGFNWKTAKAKNSVDKLAKKYTIIEANLDFRLFFSSFAAQDRYISDYASCYTTINNEVIVTINNARFLELAEEGKILNENDRVTEIARPSFDNPQKALIVINVPQAAKSESSIDFGKATIRNGENNTKFLTPFATESMIERIQNHYSHTKKIDFSCKYTGEKLFDKVTLPKVYDENYSKATIENCSLKFSTYAVWSDISARIYEEGET